MERIKGSGTGPGVPVLRAFFGAVAVLFLAWGLAFSPVKAEEVSGSLVNGFRVLDAAKLAGAPDFTVYRGDYIKFEFNGEKGTRFTVPDLEIEGDLPARSDQAPYFKMKQVGRFAYSLGETRGVINVIEYAGAYYQALTAQDAQTIMETLRPLILDVRTPNEFKAARIEGARLLPVQVLQQNLSVLSTYKEEPVLIYCATGNRSTVAAKILIDNGFKRIYNLKKGIKDWAEQGFPVVK